MHTSCPVRCIYWNENVILTKFSSLAALKVVKMITFSAASDEIIIKMTTFPFQCIRPVHIEKVQFINKHMCMSMNRTLSIHDPAFLGMSMRRLSYPRYPTSVQWTGLALCVCVCVPEQSYAKKYTTSTKYKQAFVQENCSFKKIHLKMSSAKVAAILSRGLMR